MSEAGNHPLHGTDVLIVGGGVIGLTTAIVLTESGARVRIWSRDPIERTTSAVAAAVWHPYLVEPIDECTKMALEAWAAFNTLSHDPDSGVFACETTLYTEHAEPMPTWAAGLHSFERVAASEPFADGQRFPSFVMRTPVYLPWLERQALTCGVTIERRTVASLEETAAEAPVVVNCTGLGARALVDDAAISPVRGQIVRMTNPGLQNVTLFEHETFGSGYVIPRGDDCVLGGSVDPGAECCVPNAELTAAIVRRCTSVVPQLEGQEVIESIVGLRPCRNAVRLDIEHTSMGGIIAHHYGHGGAGVTMSWGSARQLSGILAHAAAH